MSEIELKPCPMCGCVAQVNTWTMHGITESRCFCSNSDCPNSVRTVSLEQWNTREDSLEEVRATAMYETERRGWDVADMWSEVVEEEAQDD